MKMLKSEKNHRDEVDPSTNPVDFVPSQDNNELKENLALEPSPSTNPSINQEVCKTLVQGVFRSAQTFEAFAPYITSFLKLGEEIIELYDKAKHNKELCGFLLKRCNCAMAAVKDLNMRRTEDPEFFSKRQNEELFEEFIKCMKKIKVFIHRVGKLRKLIKYVMAQSIEDDLKDLVEEFDGCMASLNFSFNIQSRTETKKIKDYVTQIYELLVNVYGIPDDRQSQQNFLDRMDLMTRRNREFQIQDKDTNKISIKNVEINEPLLVGDDYQTTDTHRSKKVEKRISIKDSTDVSFKEFSNDTSSDYVIDAQIEIRRQVNILKILKNSDHIIRFFGVAQKDSKFYLVTEWMDHGNLREYYTNFKNHMNWETKIKFALDICRGVSYLHDCGVSQ